MPSRCLSRLGLETPLRKPVHPQFCPTRYEPGGCLRAAVEQLTGSLLARMSIIESMVIDMDEAQVRTVEQVRQVLEGTQALQFRAAQDDEGLNEARAALFRRVPARA